MKIRDIQSRAGTIDSEAVNVTIKDIPIGDIHVKENIRKEYTGLEELQASIREYGLLQPITVFPVVDGYTVKTGHRRFMAYQKLYGEEPEKFHSIRCIITDAKNIAVVQLVENVQRVNLSQIDLVYALTALKNESMTMKQIAEVIGKAEGYTKNLFMGVAEILSDDDLKDIVSHTGVTIMEIVETKGIQKQERLELLNKRGKGEVSRSHLRERTKSLKCGNLMVHDRAVTPEHQIEVFIEREPRGIIIWTDDVDKQTSITIEADIQNYFGDHKKYKVVRRSGEGY